MGMVSSGGDRKRDAPRTKATWLRFEVPGEALAAVPAGTVRIEAEVEDAICAA